MNAPPELPPIEITQAETGNVLPLLHEIRHGLHRLLEKGEETVIDLRSIPLTAAEERLLDAFLGSGEAQARLQALGESLFQETAISGVWRIEHRNDHGEIMGKYIEIAPCPMLLLAQEADMHSGLALLNQRLRDFPERGENER